MKVSRKGRPSNMAPLVSANSYSPASTVASFSFHDAGTVCIAASVDHLTTLDCFNTPEDLSSMLRETKKDRKALIDLQRSVEVQLVRSARTVAVLGSPVAAVIAQN